MLKKYIYDHDCSLNTTQSNHMQASASVVGSCLIDDFRFMSIDRFISKTIIHQARTKLTVNINYRKT